MRLVKSSIDSEVDDRLRDDEVGDWLRDDEGSRGNEGGRELAWERSGPRGKGSHSGDGDHLTTLTAIIPQEQLLDIGSVKGSVDDGHEVATGLEIVRLLGQLRGGSGE